MSFSSKSQTLIPTLDALSIYAGPIPFLVVPILLAPLASSWYSSCKIWYGIIICARLEIFSLLVSIPLSSRLFTSPSNTSGLITTPLPITAPLADAKIPEGIKRILKVWSSISIVCPALLPPLERTA